MCHIPTSMGRSGPLISGYGGQGFLGMQGATGSAGLSGPAGVSAGVSGFAPGFDPNARRARRAPRRRGGSCMRVVPIPALGNPTPTNQQRQIVLDLVTKLIKWPKKKKNKFWKTMQELSDWLVWLSGTGEQMVATSKAISPVLRSALNTAIAAKKWTSRTQQTLETIKAELEQLLDPSKAGQPRPTNEAFWRK